MHTLQPQRSLAITLVLIGSMMILVAVQPRSAADPAEQPAAAITVPPGFVVYVIASVTSAVISLAKARRVSGLAV